MTWCLSFRLFMHCCYGFLQLFLYLHILVCLDVGLNTIVSVTYNKQFRVGAYKKQFQKKKPTGAHISEWFHSKFFVYSITTTLPHPEIDIRSQVC